MLNAETFFKDICPCPCGSGKLVKQTTIPDTPWGRAFVAYRIECLSCHRKFYAREGKVINIEDERKRTEAFGRKLDAEEAVVRLMAPEIEAYFDSDRFRSKASEHREMQRLNLNPRSLVNYRRERADKKSFKDLCYPVRNRDWLVSLAGPSSKDDTLASLLQCVDERIKAYNEIEVETHTFAVE